MQYKTKISGNLLEVSLQNLGAQIGYLQLIIWSDNAEIRLWAVHADYREKGYAREMLKRAVEKLKSNTRVGIIKVVPHPEDILSGQLIKLEELYGVYSKLGFEFVEENPDIHKIGQKMFMYV